MRLAEIRKELAKLRKELEFIEGQLHNDALLASEDIGELSAKDNAALTRQNERLLTEVIVLETLLEDAGPDTAHGG